MPITLVIEDDPLNQELFKSFLSHMGYEVITTATATEGLRLASEYQPMVIVMDWKLPGGINGLEATRLLKQDQATAHIPVVLVTAHRKPGDEERAYDSGCEAYIPKPLTLNTLKEVIGAQLSNR